jgi:Uma2 family endonuclease
MSAFAELGAAAEKLHPEEKKQIRRYTYEELLAELPETNQPHELWDGELIMAPSPFFFHQKILTRFHRAVEDWVSSLELGEVVLSPMDMVLSPHRVVQPDLMFISRERLHIIQGHIMGAADLVAEVISLGGRNRDRIEKRDLYEQYGVKEYWLIDPEPETVDVLCLVNSRYELVMRCGTGQIAASQFLRGFEVNLDWLFHGKCKDRS